MSKICPKCRQKPESPLLLKCGTCKVPFVDESELVESFTNDELKVIAKYLLKDWRVYVVAGVLLAVAVLLLYWQAHEGIRTQIEKFQATASNQIASAYSRATNDLGARFQVFAIDSSNQLIQAYSSVTNQIADEFQTPRIKETIESVAKGEAKTILEAEVRPTADNFRAEAELLRLATRARAYDFKAYLRLLELSKQTNDLAQYAADAVAETDRSLEKERSDLTKRIYETYQGTNFYQGPFTTDELAIRFPFMKNDKTSYNREGFVNTVRDLKQPLFLAGLMDLLTNETDLLVVDRLTAAISDISKGDFRPHDFDRIQSWWHSNESQYTNWPLSECLLGMSKMNETNFAQARTNFLYVLKLDPTADMSRALAIGCCFELGDTNNATYLATGFNATDGRYFKWATARKELETGSVDKATILFAELVNSNPTMNARPVEGAYFWRKIDWGQFHKLTSDEKH